jgi:argonaute-like protein implicated in RNA metabolism and viral defense
MGVMGLEHIVVHKKMATQTKGYVEYLLEYNNPILCGRDPQHPHIEIEPFKNLGELLSLLDVQTQFILRNTHLADAIGIQRIAWRGMDGDDQVEVSVTPETITSLASISITDTDIELRSVDLLHHVERELHQMLQHIQIYNQTPKSEGDR